MEKKKYGKGEGKKERMEKTNGRVGNPKRRKCRKAREKKKGEKRDTNGKKVRKKYRQNGKECKKEGEMWKNKRKAGKTEVHRDV